MIFTDEEKNYLSHHGILGMKWGVRRYQNPDGSLTTAGKARYAKQGYKDTNKIFGEKYTTFEASEEKHKAYKNYLRKSKLTAEIGKSEELQKQAKRMAEHGKKAKGLKFASTEELAEAHGKAYDEARRNLEKEYGRKFDPNNRDDDKIIEMEAADSGLFDKYERLATPQSEKQWNKEWDKIYDDYCNALYKEIDKNVAEQGKKVVSGYTVSGDTYRDVLKSELFYIYQEKYK